MTLGQFRATVRADERGATSLIQLVIVAPVLLFVLMLIVQFGLMFHAQNVAEQAAQEGSAAARHFEGTSDQGRSKAQAFLKAVDSTTLLGTSVTASRDGQQATVTVSGTVVSLVPGVNLSVSESASGPVERFVPPEDQP